MVFGESCNDIEMLKSVRYGYAMRNANDRAKEIPYYETLSNDENGVLKVIREYFDECK